jgi:hypothetical protein
MDSEGTTLVAIRVIGGFPRVGERAVVRGSAFWVFEDLEGLIEQAEFVVRLF